MRRTSLLGGLVLVLGGCWLLPGLPIRPDGNAVPSPTPALDLAVGCETFETQRQVSQSVEATVGDELRVTLCSNPSTGYGWGEPTIDAPGVIEVTGWRSDPPAEPMPGAAGTETWALRALASGESSLHLSYGQPWDGGDKDAWTYELDVTVR